MLLMSFEDVHPGRSAAAYDADHFSAGSDRQTLKQERGGRSRASQFGRNRAVPPQPARAGFHLLVSDVRHGVDVSLRQFEVDLFGHRWRERRCLGRDLVEGDEGAGLETACQGIGTHRLHSDDDHIRTLLLDRRGDPTEQASATHCNHHQIGLG